MHRANVAKEVAERTAWAESPEGKKKIGSWHEDAKKAGWTWQWEYWNKRQKWAEYDSRQRYVSVYDQFPKVVQAAKLGWKLKDKIDFYKESPY